MHDPGDKEGAPVPDSSNIHFTGQLSPLSKDKIPLCNRGKNKTAQGWKAVSMRAEKRSLASKHGHLDSCSAHGCAAPPCSRCWWAPYWGRAHLDSSPQVSTFHTCSEFAGLDTEGALKVLPGVTLEDHAPCKRLTDVRINTETSRAGITGVPHQIQI